jgi:hypothetical protein
MNGSLRSMWGKVCITIAMMLSLVVGTLPIAHAAPAQGSSSGGVQPKGFTCQFTSAEIDKYATSSLDPVSGNGYTLTVKAEFGYDSGNLCWTRSVGIIQEVGNLFNGTLTLNLSNCTSQVDSVQIPFQGGGGTFTYYGNKSSAGCAETTGFLVASNGYRLPSGFGSADSGRQLG